MIGSLIYRFRSEKNISQKKLAELSGVTQSMITDWETGKTSPTASSLKLVADALGVPVDFLLSNFIETVDTPLSEKEKEVLTKFNDLDESGRRAALHLLTVLSSNEGVCS